MSIWSRLRIMARRNEAEHDLDEEMRSHLDLAVEDYLERGLPEPEARRLARLRFGSVESAKDAHRDSRGIAWLEGLVYDGRFAVRGLMRDRSYASTSVLMLGLAIGLNLAVFGVVNTMLFRGFPLVKDNGRLVYIQERYTLKNGCCLLYADFLAWRDRVRSFREMAFVAAKPVSISDDTGSRDAYPTMITANTFGMLGVKPVMGRDFTREDEAPGAPQVLILPHGLWVERYGRRADIIGHRLRINKAPATIIGVMPEGFDFPAHGAMWMPLQPTREMLERRPDGFFAVGRLADRSTLEGARAELDVVNRQLDSAFPASNKGVRATARRFAEFELGPDAQRIYGSVWVAAVFVLLIACANLANLTLARTLGRAREFSTRIALGAGAWRMARQLFTESLLVAVVGGCLGWWLGQMALRAWVEATWTRYVVLDYSAGAGMTVYWAVITACAALLFGSIPIVRAVRIDVNGGMKGDGRGSTLSRGTKRLSGALVAGQMALAIVLVAGSGVLARSLWNIVGADVGVHGADRVLVGSVQVPREEYPSPQARNGYWDRLQASLMAISGVETTALASNIPAGNPGAVPFELEGGDTGAERKPMVTRLAAGPDYFRVLGVAMLAGREFSDADGPETPPVAIVNQSFVNQYWPGQTAIGKRVGFPGRDERTRWYTVAGLAPNIMQDRPLRDKFVPIVYVPFRQNPAAVGALFVRTRVPAGKVAAKVREAIERSASGATLEDYSTMQATFRFDRDRMDLEHAELGKHAAVAPIFALIALFLAITGLYAAVANSVRKRSREIGVRIALGAAPGKVRRLILAEALAPVLSGLAIGLAASLAVNRVLQSQLVGVSPYDALTLSLAPAILLSIAILGCLVPARQAARVDPAVALRHD